MRGLAPGCLRPGGGRTDSELESVPIVMEPTVILGDPADRMACLVRRAGVLARLLARPF